MDLIGTSEFGFADKPTAEKKVLVIPKTAPLITGKRAVVYVEEPGQESSVHRYVGREVVLGPRTGDYYTVLSGLRAGEKVVTQGNFKIDSALQIEARPSMMNPAGYYSERDAVFSQGTGGPVESAGVLVSSLPHYLAFVAALSEDDPHKAAQNLEQFKSAVKQAMKKYGIEYQEKGIAREMKRLLENLHTIQHDLHSLRLQLAAMTETLKDIFQKYEYKEELTLYLIFCPMAFGGKGGYWLQDSEAIKNPYFGSKMLKCGEIQDKYGRIMVKRQPQTGHQHHH
jgi:Cu(I)/Ag(I) efflux system membrane fusion protein